jgi:hypothetical protein
MKTNDINKFLIEQVSPSQVLGEQSMSSVIEYDDFMRGIAERIKTYDIDTLTQTIMTMIKMGNLEQIGGNFYKYKDFHILELLKRDGADYSNKLKTLDKLNLDITQKHIETIDKDGSVYIITQIPGTEKSNLTPLWEFGTQNVSKENRIKAFHDLQKLTKAGHTDDTISSSNKMWYVNSKNKIIIPVFEHLRPINKNENPKEIIEKYYNILFK